MEIAYKKIYEVFNKVTPTGMLSVTKSRNLITFLILATSDGLENIKKQYSDRKFKSNMNDLLKCDITEEFIEEEYQKNRFKRKKQTYEFIEIKFDLNDQVPEGYVEPKSKFNIEKLLHDSKNSGIPE
ncbi:hypothetical protein BJD20_20020 [Acinetobacter proteolyticus]|nr:hypothetical protein BJD20_20020 [Acinetobacter proteolyticus]